MLVNETTLYVIPIDAEAICVLVSRVVPKKPNQEFIISDGAAVVADKFVTSRDCVSEWIEPRYMLHDGKVQMVYDMPVRIKTKTDTGWRIPTNVDFYFPIQLNDLKGSYCMAPVTLKKFMGTRYNYNPRIRENMRGLLHEINSMDIEPVAEV